MWAPAFLKPDDPSISLGSNAEDAFISAVESYGGKIIRRSTNDEDYKEHWDYLVSFADRYFTVEVKSMKCLARGSEPQDEYVCIELHGNHPKNGGWLFDGKADIIAFQTRGGGYILTWRKKLCRLANRLIDRNIRVNSSSQAFYCVYNRKGHEQVGWIRTSDLFTDGVVASTLRV